MHKRRRSQSTAFLCGSALLSLLVQRYLTIEVNVLTQTVQIREMNWNEDASEDGYVGSHGDWHAFNDGYDDDGDDYQGDYGGDDDVDEEESIESDSLHRRSIINGLHASSVQHLDLSDRLWRSSVTMESFQPGVENIIVALQSNRSLKTVEISWEVLAAIGEIDQGRLFCSLGNLPTLLRMSLDGGAGSPTRIHTRVLADALSETSNGLNSLVLYGLKISSRSEVEQLARGLKSIVETLERLTLGDIVLDVEDKAAFLDPILLALAPAPGQPRGQLSYLRLSCVEAAPNGASVVSPEALRSFFAEEPIGNPTRTFHLQNLDLNDNHCEVMALELARRDDASLRPIYALDMSVLNLTGNPSIGQHGYAAILGLLNRGFDIRAVEVDDQNWKTTFDLVESLNGLYHRRRFLRNGVFPSRTMLVSFLAEIASIDPYGNKARKLNAIWYTLRESPDLIYI
jgi:hypothetical protein